MVAGDVRSHNKARRLNPWRHEEEEEKSTTLACVAKVIDPSCPVPIPSSSEKKIDGERDDSCPPRTPSGNGAAATKKEEEAAEEARLDAEDACPAIEVAILPSRDPPEEPTDATKQMTPSSRRTTVAARKAPGGGAAHHKPVRQELLSAVLVTLDSFTGVEMEDVRDLRSSRFKEEKRPEPTSAESQANQMATTTPTTKTGKKRGLALRFFRTKTGANLESKASTKTGPKATKIKNQQAAGGEDGKVRSPPEKPLDNIGEQKADPDREYGAVEPLEDVCDLTDKTRGEEDPTQDVIGVEKVDGGKVHSPPPHGAMKPSLSPGALQQSGQEGAHDDKEPPTQPTKADGREEGSFWPPLAPQPPSGLPEVTWLPSCMTGEEATSTIGACQDITWVRPPGKYGSPRKRDHKQVQIMPPTTTMACLLDKEEAVDMPDDTEAENTRAAVEAMRSYELQAAAKREASDMPGGQEEEDEEGDNDDDQERAETPSSPHHHKDENPNHDTVMMDMESIDQSTMLCHTTSSASSSVGYDDDKEGDGGDHSSWMNHRRGRGTETRDDRVARRTTTEPRDHADDDDHSSTTTTTTSDPSLHDVDDHHPPTKKKKERSSFLVTVGSHLGRLRRRRRRPPRRFAFQRRGAAPPWRRWSLRRGRKRTRQEKEEENEEKEEEDGGRTRRLRLRLRS